MKALNITGERYGRLTALYRLPGHGRRTIWLFRCDCNKEKPLPLEAVRARRTRSCGCLQIEKVRARSLTHGHRIDRKTSRTLKAWEHAKQRCFNLNDKKYPRYGGRGITMCQEWQEDF